MSVDCDNCGSTFTTAGGLGKHHTSCTPEAPLLPRKRLARCQVCSLFHTPRCDPGRRWDVSLLVAACGGPTEVCDRARISAEVLAAAEAFGATDLQADRWAVRCGRHPGEIWAGWAEAALTVHDAAFVAGGWRRAWLAEVAS